MVRIVSSFIRVTVMNRRTSMWSVKEPGKILAGSGTITK
jgi:hypothetical protein